MKTSAVTGQRPQPQVAPSSQTHDDDATGQVRARVPIDRWLRLSAWAVFVVVMCYLVVSPIVNLQSRAFGGGLAAFRNTWIAPGIASVVRNTVALGLGSVCIAVLLGVCSAWAVRSLPARYRPFLAWVPIVPLLLPPVATVAGWGFLLSPPVGYINSLLRGTPLFDHLDSGPINVYSVPWVVIITGLILSAYVHMFVYSSLREIGPEYGLAAQACGASPLRSFVTVTLPLLRPSIVYSTVIVLLLGLGQFVAPLLLGRQEGIDVLTTSIWKLTQNYPVNYEAGAALGSPLIVLGVIAVLLQRRIVGNSSQYALSTGSTSREAEFSRGRIAAGYLIVLGVFTAVLPLVALMYLSFSPYWSGDMSLSALTLDNYRGVLNDPIAFSALSTSVSASALAVCILVPVGTICAVGLWQRHHLPRWLVWLLDATVSVPLAVPAALMGFGLLFTYTSPPVVLYGQESMLVLTYFILMLPFATRMILATLMSVGTAFFEASAVCGAGRVRTLLHVGLPLCRGGLGAAAGISFVLMIHEFAASLMVRSPTTQVLGSYLWDQWTRGSYPRVAVAALLMVVVTGLGLFVTRLISGTSKGR